MIGVGFDDTSCDDLRMHSALLLFDVEGSLVESICHGRRVVARNVRCARVRYGDAAAKSADRDQDRYSALAGNHKLVFVCLYVLVLILIE